MAEAKIKIVSSHRFDNFVGFNWITSLYKHKTNDKYDKMLFVTSKWFYVQHPNTQIFIDIFWDILCNSFKGDRSLSNILIYTISVLFNGWKSPYIWSFAFIKSMINIYISNFEYLWGIKHSIYQEAQFLIFWFKYKIAKSFHILNSAAESRHLIKLNAEL